MGLPSTAVFGLDTVPLGYHVSAAHHSLHAPTYTGSRRPIYHCSSMTQRAWSDQALHSFLGAPCPLRDTGGYSAGTIAQSASVREGRTHVCSKLQQQGTCIGVIRGVQHERRIGGVEGGCHNVVQGCGAVVAHTPICAPPSSHKGATCESQDKARNSKWKTHQQSTAGAAGTPCLHAGKNSKILAEMRCQDAARECLHRLRKTRQYLTCIHQAPEGDGIAECGAISHAIVVPTRQALDCGQYMRQRHDCT